MTELSLLTYNIRRDTPRDGPDRWRHRRDRVAATVRRSDVAGLQEATGPQLRDLMFGAPEHRWVGVGRADGRRAGEMVPVLWRADRFALVDHGHFWLSSRPDVPGSRDHSEAITRMATWARLAERGTDRPLFVLNTHLDHRVEAARRDGARQVRHELDRLVGDEPVVVTADLNDTPGGVAHVALTEDGGHRVVPADAHDLAEERVGPDTTYNRFEAPWPGRRIDVVLVAGAWRVRRYEVDDRAEGGRYASDHFPVVVRASPG